MCSLLICSSCEPTVDDRPESSASLADSQSDCKLYALKNRTKQMSKTKIKGGENLRAVVNHNAVNEN